MAKKIHTFADYDAQKRKLELGLPRAAGLNLEQMLFDQFRKDASKTGHAVKKNVSPSTGQVQALFLEPGKVALCYVVQQDESYALEAEKAAQLDYFQQSMTELIICSVSMSKSHSSLDEDQKQSFYARFIDNVKELTDSKYFAHFKMKYLGVEQMLQGFRLPDQEGEKFKAVKIVTDGLYREKYITRKNTDTIIRLLSSRQEVQAFPARPPPAKAKTPVLSTRIAGDNLPPQDNQNPDQLREINEYLTVVLGLSEGTAQSYLRKVNLEQLNQFHQQMKETVGDEYTCRLVQINPDLVLYPSQNMMTKYLTTLQLVQGRIRSKGGGEKVETEFGLESNVKEYASLEQLLVLKRRLFQGTGDYHATTSGETAAQDFQIYVSRYAFLKKNKTMERRLDSLIRTGELGVKVHEHWGGERTTTGARGRDILKVVRTELNRLFTDLGYESPGCDLNFGQNKLTIPERTQQLLGEIRNKAYSVQKE
ncbi:MAG TPA: hypothetical protein VJI32_00080 [Candidatus Nanoarchaeia archaeon]|nr:hypothetical protein [Candidatus Nanoarchaeia archaeon]